MPAWSAGNDAADRRDAGLREHFPLSFFDAPLGRRYFAVTNATIEAECFDDGAGAVARFLLTQLPGLREFIAIDDAAREYQCHSSAATIIVDSAFRRVEVARPFLTARHLLAK